MRAAVLELIAPSVCPGCDVPRRPGHPLLCSRCRRSLVPLAQLRGVRTAVTYEGIGAELVRRFKFQGRNDALEVLLAVLAAQLAPLRFDGIVPVPRHPVRIRERGDDPVYRLGRALAREVGRPLWPNLLRRTRARPAQAGLGLAARRRNVAGSFRARARPLSGRRILLLDDVVTTGATLASAAAELRRATGVRSVLRAALAGTPALSLDPPPAL